VQTFYTDFNSCFYWFTIDLFRWNISGYPPPYTLHWHANLASFNFGHSAAS